MAVRANAPAMLELVAEDAELEELGAGFVFTEGPIWNPDGFLLFSDMPGDTRRRWDERGGVAEVASPSNKGNGMTLDAHGRLLVCEHVTSSLVRMDPDGSGANREVLASHYEGKELNSPNDVVVKRDGSIYFTDPTYGRMPGFGVEREQELSIQGVYRIAPDGGEPQLLIDDFQQPNGLCFSPDESKLYINDTGRAHIREFQVAGDGTIDRGRALAEGLGSGDLDVGDLVDGMKCDERGNIWVTGPGVESTYGVLVISPQGEHLGTIDVPEGVGNIGWGGPDWNWLFVCACTRLWRIICRVSGNRVSYMR
ncbi:MAG: SMP-30/gluconolactonase/LRE family protein [Solirubrobacterales bacterium]|nr:SMP-30/gluconolactonase/LRE family protein [Solirubrobacterales bacterium]